jgi:phosphate uptake regulator
MADKTCSKSIEKEKLTRRITFRLSEFEYAQVSDELAVCGLSLSAFARKRLLSQRVASKADLAMLGELRRLGGLLKHIHNETRGAYSNLTAQAIKDLSAYVRTLTMKQRSVPGDTEAHQ